MVMNTSLFSNLGSKYIVFLKPVVMNMMFPHDWGNFIKNISDQCRRIVIVEPVIKTFGFLELLVMNMMYCSFRNLLHNMSGQCERFKPQCWGYNYGNIADPYKPWKVLAVKNCSDTLRFDTV